MKVYYIEWVDATAAAGWTDCGITPMPCVSVGFLVEETKKHICLALTTDPDGEEVYNALMSIPKGWIKKKKRIKI